VAAAARGGRFRTVGGGVQEIAQIVGGPAYSCLAASAERAKEAAMASRVNERHARGELVTGRGRGPGLPLPPVRPQARCCPVPGCGHLIDPSRLMCRRHWYLVPKQLRDWVWATWRSGEGACSREHHDAVLMAIATAAARR
jgi:hypothetical protein